MIYSTIQAVDFALGGYIAKVFPQKEVIHGAKNWQAFNRRPVKEKIMRGDFETVTEVMAAIESSQKQVSTNSKVKYNSVSLPMVAYGRKANISPADPDAGAIIKKTVKAEGDIELILAQIEIDYRIMLMAWDIPTLDQMQMAWMFYSAFHADLSYTEVEGQSLELSARILDAKTPMFEDASISSKESRLHAVIIPIQVQTYVAQGQVVEVPDPISINFGFDHIK